MEGICSWSANPIRYSRPDSRCSKPSQCEFGSIAARSSPDKVWLRWTAMRGCRSWCILRRDDLVEQEREDAAAAGAGVCRVGGVDYAARAGVGSDRRGVLFRECEVGTEARSGARRGDAGGGDVRDAGSGVRSAIDQELSGRVRPRRSRCSSWRWSWIQRARLAGCGRCAGDCDSPHPHVADAAVAGGSPVSGTFAGIVMAGVLTRFANGSASADGQQAPTAAAIVTYRSEHRRPRSVGAALYGGPP